MVRSCVYFFEPQKEPDDNLAKYNNSDMVTKMKIGNFVDITCIEIPVAWHSAKNVIDETYGDFDSILSVGETDTLLGHAEIEIVAKVGGHSLKNTPITKFVDRENLKKNFKYDPSNNFTCNRLNFYLIEKQKRSRDFNFTFVHVPVRRTENSAILRDLKALLSHLRTKSEEKRTHKISARIEKNLEVGYTDVEETCEIEGIFFPFNNYKKPEEHTYNEITMENTPIPLDIIFLSVHSPKPKGKKQVFKIDKICKGCPYSQKLTCGWSHSVLEMPHPYCRVNKVQAGHTIEIIPFHE